MDLKFLKWYFILVEIPTIYVHCDNQSTIRRAQSSMYNGKSRHIHNKNNTIKFFSQMKLFPLIM
jgi:hypothetical protein